MSRLLLDIGGVVIRTPFEMLQRFDGVDWRGPFDPASDPLWRAMQRGEATEREYWEERARSWLAGDGSGGSGFAGDGSGGTRRLMRLLYDRPEVEVVRPEVVELLEAVERPAALTNDLSAFHSRE
ncbi:MAG: hypothetical protein ACRDZ5_08565, partial [Acidimicrobiales bacterium]